MKNTYLRHRQPESKYERIVKSREMEYIEFDMLKLDAGAVYNNSTSGYEEGLLILNGKCSVSGKDFDFSNIGDRMNVFDGKPYCVYLPFNTLYEIKALTDVEVALCRTPSDLKSKPQLIKPEDVIVKDLGKDNWQRKAYLILDERIGAKHIYIGEAIVPAGNWAGFPPHRHDYDNLPHEVDMEEVYFYRFDKPQGFGIQKVYTDDGDIDETYTVKNDDTVMISRGYHPVAAAPGYGMYYLWIMAGKNRKFLSTLNPEHRWIAEG